MFIAEAPIVVVLCGRKYVNHHSWFGECMYLLEAAISMDHFVLAARNEGLGTCWVGAFDKQGIEKLLDIPPDFPPVMITPLGYPRDKYAFSEVIDRESLDKISYSEKYGRKLPL
jgi:nitroreductase